MADDTDVANKTRKTVTLSHRQIGATGLIGLAVALAPYLKETFVTREEGAQVAIQLEYMRKDLTELKTTVTYSRDIILEQIKESEARTNRTDDRLEHRIDGLEAAIRPKNKTY
jgi:hypothetical protein